MMNNKITYNGVQESFKRVNLTEGQDLTLDYDYIKSITEGHGLPCTATNSEGDTVVIERGCAGGEEFFRLETYQKNDWIRINEYYEDGTVTELYER